MRLRPVGRTAALIEVEDPDEVRAWHAAVLELVRFDRLPRPDDVVPGARSVLVDGVEPEVLARCLPDVPPVLPVVAGVTGDGPVVEIPVSYDGADLAEVARQWRMTAAGVIERHTATEFRVAFCGFAPGFAYLVGLDEEVPRRSTPRTSVPAGSVALAGRYCGIYPSASPGGWQLLGRTDRQLFDAERDPPALLPPGTRVRFVAVSGPPHPPARSPQQSPPEVGGRRAITVVRPGPLSTVQDGGRPGHAHLGVPRSGSLDSPAATLANRLVGNPASAAVLEATLGGLALRTSVPLTVAVTGAAGPVSVDGRPVAWGAPVDVPTGGVLDIGPAVAGVRAYVAIAGGIEVPPVLGSRATDTLSGLGPAALRAGDVLPVGTPSEPLARVDFTTRRAPGEVVLRLAPGPREDWFGPAGLAALARAPYTVSPASSRVGVRLQGPTVPRAIDGELESEGMVLGAVQVPPDGQPVVFLADHPTTGGYPVIGVVDPDDLPTLAQARPGTTVRFATAKGPLP